MFTVIDTVVFGATVAGNNPDAPEEDCSAMAWLPLLEISTVTVVALAAREQNVATAENRRAKAFETFIIIVLKLNGAFLFAIFDSGA